MQINSFFMQSPFLFSIQKCDNGRPANRGSSTTVQKTENMMQISKICWKLHNNLQHLLPMCGLGSSKPTHLEHVNFHGFRGQDDCARSLARVETGKSEAMRKNSVVLACARKKERSPASRRRTKQKFQLRVITADVTCNFTKAHYPRV
jgi:hypothetical protein